MTIGLLIAFGLICFVADLAARKLLQHLRGNRRRREWEEALAVSLKLDVTREAKSLKRAEVPNPAARILCIDDEEIVLDSFRKILVLDGYSVDTVQTGPEALGLIQAHDYDFVFTDLRMPIMDGVEVVKAVKHTRPDIDVIIITGYATVETAVDCMRFGAMDYVQKPFTEDELRGFVKKALIRREDQRARQLKPVVHITRRGQPDPIRPSEFSIPGGVLISPGHCWASLSSDGSVQVGLDDFAKKLIGRVDAVEWPIVGTNVNAGDPLFVVLQKGRRIQFLAPISGRVTAINRDLNDITSALDETSYDPHWIITVEAQNLEVEIPTLKIGKSAEALFQEDLGRFDTFLRESIPSTSRGQAPASGLCLGALATLTDSQWERGAHQFFGRRA